LLFFCFLCFSSCQSLDIRPFLARRCVTLPQRFFPASSLHAYDDEPQLFCSLTSALYVAPLGFSVVHTIPPTSRCPILYSPPSRLPTHFNLCGIQTLNVLSAETFILSTAPSLLCCNGSLPSFSFPPNPVLSPSSTCFSHVSPLMTACALAGRFT